MAPIITVLLIPGTLSWDGVGVGDDEDDDGGDDEDDDGGDDKRFDGGGGGGSETHALADVLPDGDVKNGGHLTHEFAVPPALELYWSTGHE